MSENPLQLLFKTYEKLSNSIQSQLAHFISVPKPPSSHNDDHSFSWVLSSSSPKNLPPSKSPTSQHSELPKQEKNAGPVTKEDLGRATWTFLHTLGAQQYVFINNIDSTQLSKYPEKPTRQQKRDVKELMAILSRMYPCKECADHFKEVLRANPVQAGSQAEFSQWLCYMHNVVNRSLNKPIFPCDRVDARWGKLDCEQRACDLQGTDKFWP